mmetsp:Transcript_68201/g.127303  ORF Transcript_68201/g.127303 Transcript_68201/m.127303 type:complete len:165 (+) Transcript_68201:97-591(+)
MGDSPSKNAICTCCVKRDYEYQGEQQPYRGRPSYASSGSHSALGSAQSLSTGPCIVCREGAANTICLPCGHLLICFRCSLRYVLADGSLHPDVRCPCCKQQVSSFQRVFTQSPAMQLPYVDQRRSDSVGSSRQLQDQRRPDSAAGTARTLSSMSRPQSTLAVQY